MYLTAFFDVFSGSISWCCYLQPAQEMAPMARARYWILRCQSQNQRQGVFETSGWAPRLSRRQTETTFQCAERKREKNTTSLIIPVFWVKCDIHLLIEKWNSSLIFKAVSAHRPLINPDSCLPASVFVCVCAVCNAVMNLLWDSCFRLELWLADKKRTPESSGVVSLPLSLSTTLYAYQPAYLGLAR